MWGPSGPKTSDLCVLGVFLSFFLGLCVLGGHFCCFLKILSSILEPVMHLSMGQNCGKICFGAYFPDLGVFGGSF